MVTRKQLHAFQRNEITLILANGSTLKIPAMNVVAALLNVITPEQRRKVLEGTALLGGRQDRVERCGAPVQEVGHREVRSRLLQPRREFEKDRKSVV